MKVAALFSGGKDSTYAVYTALQRGWDVTHLIVVQPADPVSGMFHVPNLHATPLLADAMGIPLVQERAGSGEVEELEALERAIRAAGADSILVGAIASDFQHARVNRVCSRLGVRVFAPLWRRNPEGLLADYVGARFDIRFSAVAAEGLDAPWLGRSLDASAIGDLLRLRDRVGLNPCGEGGEFETIVLHAPFFRKRLTVLAADVVWEGTSGHWRIREAQLT